jgi:adenylylsulfate kinase-like enzyme
MKRPEITITISGPAGCGKSTLAGALIQRLYMLGCADVAAPDELVSDLGQGLQVPRNKRLRDLLGKARVRIFTTNEGA